VPPQEAIVYGYAGRVLIVQADTGAWHAMPLSPAEAQRWLGGAGLAVWWLYQFSRPGIEPLDPSAPLVLAGCPLVDTGITTTSRAAFAARSPQTRLLGESLISSHFAVALRRAGWDGLVLTGAAPEWSVLLVGESEVRILPAPELQGLSAPAAEQAIRQRWGGELQVAAIGPAGEHGVAYATISHDGRHAGRTGMGAVLGAHRCKAIAFRGERRTPCADPAGLAARAAGLRTRSLGPETARYRLVGTSANLLTFDRLGILPSRNFQAAAFPDAAQLTGEQLAGGLGRERTGCAGCTIGCEHRFLPAAGKPAVRAEYESLYALGPLLGIGDPEVVLEAIRLCDEYGMDSISLGGTLAWAMECGEHGAGKAWLSDGPALRFGDGEAVLEWIPRIAGRRGTGPALLAEGSRTAAGRVGEGSERWAIHVKGLELPGYEPRALKTLALGLAVSARGACHNRSSAYDRDLAAGRDRLEARATRGRDAAEAEDLAAVLDSLVLCKFLRRCFDDLYSEAAELYHLVTGLPMGGPELRAAGGRIVTLKRLYNQREGATRADDTLPPRLLEELLPEGPAAGAGLSRPELEAMLDDYYQVRGWGRDGLVPTALAQELLSPRSDPAP